MSEYVPATEEVRDAAGIDGATAIEFDAFDAWLAAHDREVKAEALRDAGDDLKVLVDGQHPDSLNPDQWLNDRADRIESQETP